MSEATYAERLALYVEQLPEPLKDTLLVKVAVCLFGAQNGSGPERLTAFGAALKLLADFAPELHEHHDRRALTDALGDYVVEWWSEILKRPLTGRDLDRLVEELPDSGIREALQRLAERQESER